jgi:hypothetical protein
MTGNRQSGKRRKQAGSALLIAIFALLLISVVGLALLVSTGTDTALALNYRNSTGGYYASVAGLEEARGRLLQKNADYINKTGAYPTLFTGQGTPSFGLTDVLYVVNPAAGETVDPTDPASPYADKEYQSEMGWSLSGANVNTPVISVSAMAGFPGPSFKWVRINPVTEQALGMNVNGAPPPLDSFTPLYSSGNGLNLNNTGNEALEITAFVMMPDNTKRLLQYVVAANTISSQLPSNPFPPPTPPPIPNLDFPAALTFAGNNVAFQGAGTATFFVNGRDQGNCSPPNYMVASIGFTNSFDASKANITAGALPIDNYPGYPPGPGGPPPPPSQAPVSIQDVSTSMPTNWQTPAGLDAVVQNITANADVVINSDATGNDILSKAPTMSPLNPTTIVVNGNLDLSAWHNTGYGLLLVTGNLYYDPDASWKGIVLVIGQGNFVSTRSGTGEIDGAVFIAKTRDSSGALLPALGAASFSQTGGGTSGYGIHYNSCWIHGVGNVSGAQGPLNYKVLSFREITQ